MAKKKRKDVPYERNGLQCVANSLQKNKQSLQSYQKDLLSLDGLEVAIKKMPKDQREIVEKFFGLLPGTINHSIKYQAWENTFPRKPLDVSMATLSQKAHDYIMYLYSLDYSVLYDGNLQPIISKLLTKIDRTNISGLTDLEIIKYLLIYLEIICEGPNFYSDLTQNYSDYAEQIMVFDHYLLLRQAWNSFLASISNASFNMALIVEWVQTLNLRDRAKILQSFNLSIPNELVDYVEGSPLHTFSEIRAFKEHLFPDGPWHIFECIVFEDDIQKFDIEALGEMFSLIRQNSRDLLQSYKSTYKTDDLLQTPTQKQYPIYRFGSENYLYQFTDIDELYSLYTMRNCLEILS